MTNGTLPGSALLMTTRLTRTTMAAVLIEVLLASSAGCRHETSPTTPTSITAAPSTPTSPLPTNTVPAANNGEVGVYRFDVTMSRSGMATVTLEWPNADFSLQLYLTKGACADITSLVTARCTIVGSTRPGSLPGVVAGLVTIGDLNTIWVLNPDPFPQRFTLGLSID